MSNDVMKQDIQDQIEFLKNNPEQKIAECSEMDAYIINWDGIFVIFDTRPETFLGGGASGDVYKAYGINDDYEPDQSSEWVVKYYFAEPVRAADELTKQFYDCSPAFEFHNGESTCYVSVMEDLGIYDLQQFEQDKELDFFDKLNVIIQSLMQLNQMHHKTTYNEQLVHGDVKPENISIKKLDHGQWLTSVLDFDLSKYKQGATQSGAPLDIVTKDRLNYTNEYMAPEMLNDYADYARISYKSDIYSLVGVILKIFDSDFWIKDPDQFYQFCVNTIKIPSDYDESNFKLKPTIQAFVERMQSKQPDQRPDTDECLKFFQKVYQYCYLRRKPNLGEDDGRRKQSLKAQLILLKMGALPVSEFDGQSWVTHVKYDVEDIPYFCQKIIEEQNTITHARMSALMAFCRDYSLESHYEKLKVYQAISAEASLAKKAYAAAILQNRLILSSQEDLWDYITCSNKLESFYKALDTLKKASLLDDDLLQQLDDKATIFDCNLVKPYATNYGVLQLEALSALCNDASITVNKKRLDNVLNGEYSQAQLEVIYMLADKSIEIPQFFIEPWSNVGLDTKVDNFYNFVINAVEKGYVVNSTYIFKDLYQNQDFHEILDYLLDCYQSCEYFNSNHYKALLKDGSVKQLYQEAIRDKHNDKDGFECVDINIKDKLSDEYFRLIMDVMDNSQLVENLPIDRCNEALSKLANDTKATAENSIKSFLAYYLPQKSLQVQKDLANEVLTQIDNVNQAKNNCIYQHDIIWRGANILRQWAQGEIDARTANDIFNKKPMGEGVARLFYPSLSEQIDSFIKQCNDHNCQKSAQSIKQLFCNVAQQTARDDNSLNVTAKDSDISTQTFKIN